jgi:enoyl-CoA hydratase/carnithine racemase
MTRSYERIKVGRAGGVETITLSNPQRRNAIGPQMISELICALGDACAADAVRSIVLTGEGRAFCSGGDFGGASVDSRPGGSAEDPRDFVDLLLAIYRSDKPVIAKVNGDALGGGLGLAAASTFSVASTAARLGTPEIDLGLFPMMIMAVLGRHVPRRRLIEMMIFGEKLEAEEAVRVGLLNRAVPPEELDAEVERLTDKIAGKSAVAIRLGLRAFAAQDDLDLEQALPMLRARFFECLGTDDAREGLTAFVEKRTPKWTGQ